MFRKALSRTDGEYGQSTTTCHAATCVGSAGYTGSPDGLVAFVSFDFGYPCSMTITSAEVTVLPPEKPLDDLLAMVEDISSAPGQQGSAELVGPNGRTVALPTELVRVLSAVIT